MGKKKGKGQGPAPRSSSNSLSEPGNTSASATASSALPAGVPSNVDQTATPAVALVTSAPVAVSPAAAAVNPAAVVSTPVGAMSTPVPIVSKTNTVPPTPSSPKVKSSPLVVAPTPVLNQAVSSIPAVSSSTVNPIGSKTSPAPTGDFIIKDVQVSVPTALYTPVKLADLGISKSSKEQTLLPTKEETSMPKQEEKVKSETVTIQKVFVPSSQHDSKAKEIEKNTLSAQKTGDEKKGSPKSPKIQQKLSPKEGKKGQPIEKVATFTDTIVEKIDTQLKSLSASSVAVQSKNEQKGQNKLEEKSTAEIPKAEQPLPEITKIMQQKIQDGVPNLVAKQSLPDLKQFATQVNTPESKENGNKIGQKIKNSNAASVAQKQVEPPVNKNIISDIKNLPIEIAQCKPTDVISSMAAKPPPAIETLLGKSVKPKDEPVKKVVSEKVPKTEEKELPKNVQNVTEPVSSPKSQPKSINKQQGNKEASEKISGSPQKEKLSKTAKEMQKQEQVAKPAPIVVPIVQPKSEDSLTSEILKSLTAPVLSSPSQDIESMKSQKNDIPLTNTQKSEDIKNKDLKASQKPEVPKKPSGLKPSKQTKDVGQKSKNDDDEQFIPGIVWEVAQKGTDSTVTQQTPSKPGNIQVANSTVESSKGVGDFFSSSVQNLPSPKGDFIPEKVKLSPEIPSSNQAIQDLVKTPMAMAVAEQTISQISSPKTPTELQKTEVLSKIDETVDGKSKKESSKKEENIAKTKTTVTKKDKNAQKNASAEEFLKDVKITEKELGKDDTKAAKLDKDSNKNQGKSTKSPPKQEKAQEKTATVLQETILKPLSTEDEKKPQESKKKPVDAATKPESQAKPEVAKTDYKSALKEEKTEKGDSKKKPKEDSTKTTDISEIKIDSKDPKATDSVQLKDSKPAGKPVQDKGNDKNNKKDKNQPKEVKPVKDDKDQKAAETKQNTSLSAKDAKLPKTKDSEDKERGNNKEIKEKSEINPKEAEKGKKEQNKNVKPQEVKPVTVKPEITLPESPSLKDDKKASSKQQKKNQADNKAQGKDITENKAPEKPPAKEKPAKPEKTSDAEKSKEKVDAKKPENTATTPPKPKAEKPKGDNKEKTVVEVKGVPAEKKKDVSISEDKDNDENSLDGNTDEATAAKKKRRRKKKNKKPAEGVSTIEMQVKPKPAEKNEPKDQKKPQENLPNKSQTNLEGTKVEKKTAKPPIKAEVSPLVPSATDKSSAPEPGDKKSNDQDQGFDTAQTKKKKNKKQKQGSGPNSDVATEPAGAKNDSAGQKKTPFDSRLSKMIVNPLAHHLSNCCCICKATSGNNQMPLQTCTACYLACYCNKEHQIQHWPEHKQFCNYITSSLSADRPYFFTPAENLSPDEKKNFRLSELQICQKALNRQLTPLESALILHPRACYTCYKPAFQNVCTGCHCINYCCIGHLPPNHQEWCSTLHIKLLFIQSQAEHGSSGVSVPRPAKIYYPLNSNMKEYLESLNFEPPKYMDKKLYISHVSELATYPLTLLHALQLLAKQGATNPLDYEHLVVHVVGAEDVYECCQILKWKYFFVNLLPNLKTLHLVFIGCELSIEDERVHVEGRLVYEFHAKMTYLDYCKKCYIKPSIVCAFNSGLYRNTGFKGTDSWGPSLYPMLSMNPGAPVLLTAYTHMESNLDLQRLKEIFLNSLQVVQLPLKNPYASIFPNHNLVSEQECPVAFRNFYLTIVRHT